MNEPPENPYSPPSAEASATASKRYYELVPLWIWLGIVVAISLLGTPADPISMLLAMAYGLATFLMGAVIGSSLNITIRILFAVLWVVPVVPLTFFSTGSHADVGLLCYSVAGLVFGFWTCRRIERGCFRVMVYLSVGYVLGSVFGLLGTVAGAALGAILARRSLSRLNADRSTVQSDLRD
jgi:hypothetical protein